ncbi:uncharacterized protein [Haliotis asinina]|uniref:uncharacterized protein n=1 Tax=Haliotis asinina TaxID=109174 RepID=UPI003531B437
MGHRNKEDYSMLDNAGALLQTSTPFTKPFSIPHQTPSPPTCSNPLTTHVLQPPHHPHAPTPIQPNCSNPTPPTFSNCTPPTFSNPTLPTSSNCTPPTFSNTTPPTFSIFLPHLLFPIPTPSPSPSHLHTPTLSIFSSPDPTHLL